MTDQEAKQKIEEVLARYKGEEECEVDIEDVAHLGPRSFYNVEDEEGDSHIVRVGSEGVCIWESRPSNAWGGRFDDRWEEIKKMETDYI